MDVCISTFRPRLWPEKMDLSRYWALLSSGTARLREQRRSEHPAGELDKGEWALHHLPLSLMAVFSLVLARSRRLLQAIPVEII